MSLLYLQDSHGYINEIKQSFSNRDAEGIIQSAHPLKSSSEQVGAMMMAKLACQIETMSRAIQDEEIESLEDIAIPLDQLEASFIKTRKVIEDLLKR